MAAEPVERKLAAILSADAVGYSRMMAEDEQGTIRTLTAYRTEIYALVEQHRGRVVDAPGDNVLAEFPTALDAVECAVEIQRVLQARNRGLPDDHRMLFRIGIHLGDVSVQEGRLYGDGVNIAARLERLAEPGGIGISSEVYGQVQNKLDLGYEDLGEQSVKNIPKPVRVYAVKLETAAKSNSARPRPGVPLAAGLVLLAFAAVAVGWWLLDGRGPEPSEILPAQIRSLAVLPLANLSGDPEQEYFVDGMTEALITKLSKIEALRVISRTSTMRYKGLRKPLPEIARELDVDAVIEGSVLRAGNRVRITAQLVHAPSDRHLWADSYDGDLDDILRLQDEVARAVVGEIRLALTPGEQRQLASRRAVAPEAYDAYLRGRSFWHRRTAKALRLAIEYFERAIEIDPDYAAAYSGLADSYSLLPIYGSVPPKKAMPRAEAAARRALEIDDSLAEAHASLGWILAYYQWDWSAAEQSLQRAIELNPNYTTAHHWYGQYLRTTGRTLELLAEAQRAVELDPLALITNRGLGHAYLQIGDYDRAIEQYLFAIELSPISRNYRSLSIAYVRQGEYEKALDALRADDDQAAWLYVLAGNTQEALRRLDALVERAEREYVDAWYPAVAYAALRNDERALKWLERAYEERAFALGLFLKAEPVFFRLHSDPRFQDLLRRMNYPESP